MRVLFCSAEVAPFAKVGGLADVAGSLPKALSALGHEVIVCMPAYGMVVTDPRWSAKLLRDDLLVRVNAFKLVRAKLYEINYDSLKVWLIDGDGLFSKIEKSEDVYSPTRDDYLFFSQAALEVCEELDWIPDVVSAHDWHMAFLPVMIRETKGKEWEKVATTYTIHNLAYQGEFGYETLEAAGVPTRLFNMHELETYGGVNFLKSGTVFADMTNTVSPNYAEEILTPEFGCRLEGMMRHLVGEGRLRGILNGIDHEVFDPQTDPHIAAHFSVQGLKGKQECRESLIRELGLRLDPTEPIMGVISRLSNQKGFDLIIEVADDLINVGSGLIVLGTGDPWAAGELRKLESRHSGKVKFIQAFDAELAQRIYSGSDIFLMPSAFEPCGLGQMFAMRYGTVPVVRRTGGLADTVFEGQNGFVFDHIIASDFAAATRRAIATFHKPDAWRKLVIAGMNSDFGWTKSANQYVSMFEAALARRAGEVASRVSPKTLKSSPACR